MYNSLQFQEVLIENRNRLSLKVCA